MSTITVSARQARAGVAVQSNRLNHIDIVRTLVTLRIGVFFDGTTNNAANTGLGLQCRASTGAALGQDDIDRAAIVDHCAPYMRAAGSSYGNGPTNVARLFDLYRNSEDDSPDEDDGDEYFMRAYIDGIGTTAGQPDTSFPGQALGIGATGVVARAEEAFLKVLRQRIDDFTSAHADKWVASIEFDVFGFSRGAAAARHFVNQVNRKANGLLAEVIAPSQLKLKPGFDWNRDIQVGFVGLFDTVVAVGSLADGFNVRDADDGDVQVALPAGCARQVVQLVARDEHRANFMLTTVAPQHREIALPGVHSDVGGSYHETTEGPLLLTKPIGFNESIRYRNGEPHWPDPKTSKAWRQTERQRQHWQAKLGLDDPAALAVDSWTWLHHRRSRVSVAQVPVPRVYAVLKLTRVIDWRYQLIPLRVMHKLATEADVPFDFIDDNDPALALPEELQPIAVKLLAEQSLNDSEKALLRRKYLHQSSHWNFEWAEQHLGRGPISADLVYVSRPDPRGAREIRPNE